jgi:hypothetical protein
VFLHGAEGEAQRAATFPPGRDGEAHDAGDHRPGAVAVERVGGEAAGLEDGDAALDVRRPRIGKVHDGLVVVLHRVERTGRDIE